ncbi:HEPN domain-containing protein [Gloeobacter violaceus]|uniref:Glr3369 protein n=1 Tax=Gloeobacter violaceus (strain ATCC 29082 / PCC 7421) TaxID=251221 RepID=Q7NG05_GLOVI|nr:HEPN domain-containing protein [Gloeobacter violaceus]BAC91310.1 glr3369 [Gloeobacter violaceus PCC 7421]
MANKAQEHLQDAEFIFDEIMRFAAMSQDEKFALLGSRSLDRLALIPNPFYTGTYLVCGVEAMRCFARMSKRYLDSRPVDKDEVDFDTFRKAVISDFGRRFVKDRKVVDTRQIDKMFTAALSRAKAEYSELTHFIPCILVHDEEPAEITIGPVRFTRREKFLAENQEEFDAERNKRYEASLKSQLDPTPKPWDKVFGKPTGTPEESASEAADFFFKRFEEYCSGFSWMAQVSVPRCHPKVSAERARLAVEGALDVLRLHLGRGRGAKLRQGNSPSIGTDFVELSRHAQGGFSFSYSFGSAEEILGPGWFPVVFEGPKGQILQAVGEMLWSYLDPSRTDQLNQRILDALSWHGQAVREILPSAKIVKFVAALERLTITKRTEDLRKTVSRRTALLLLGMPQNDPSYLKEFDHNCAEAQFVYDVRSDLMHGNRSPFDPELGVVAVKAASVAQSAISNSVSLLNKVREYVNEREGSNSPKPADLESAYTKLEAKIKVFRDSQEPSEDNAHTASTQE